MPFINILFSFFTALKKQMTCRDRQVIIPMMLFSHGGATDLILFHFKELERQCMGAQTLDDYWRNGCKILMTFQEAQGNFEKPNELLKPPV